MIRIAKATNIVEATLWHDMLTSAGIDASIQRMFLQGSIGEVPPDQATLEIWVHQEAQVTRAKALIEELRHTPQRRWFCATCREHIEGGFEQCWLCGAPMPA